MTNEMRWREIYSVVAAAHAHGLVHRDLKPANVLVAVTTTHSSPGRFRFAKIMEEMSPRPPDPYRRHHGDPAYMAPEQTDSGNGGPSLSFARWSQKAFLAAT